MNNIHVNASYFQVTYFFDGFWPFVELLIITIIYALVYAPFSRVLVYTSFSRVRIRFLRQITVTYF